jgi:hypothetical protein
VITELDPGLNPQTNRARVLVGVTGDTSNLVQGERVTVAIEAAELDPERSSDPIEIPLTALKIRPQQTSVFTVDDGTLLAHPVEVGAVVGERIQVLAGLPDGPIVRDVRGLTEGDAVRTGPEDGQGGEGEAPAPEADAATSSDGLLPVGDLPVF